MEQADEAIDLHKHSLKDLVIMMYHDVQDLKKSNYRQVNKQQVTDIELAVIKTKMQVWSAVIGFCTGLLSSIIMFVITKAFH